MTSPNEAARTEKIQEPQNFPDWTLSHVTAGEILVFQSC